MNLVNIDLNVLVALDALLEQRSVTRAAEQLNLSQPALSASLARLRRHFGDQLLTRSGNEYRLTPLAVQLKDRTRAALGSVERVFAAEPDFDPATSAREFSIVLSDYASSTFGPQLVRLLTEQAPHARLRLIANTPAVVDRAAAELLRTDLLVLPHGFVHDLSHQDLYRDGWRFVVSADNTDVGEALTFRQLETMPWLLTYFGPNASTPAMRELRLRGITPRVQVVTENFLTVSRLVAGSPRVAVLQRRLADRLPAELGVRAVDGPLDLAPLVEAMWWHPVYDDDPEHTYLRQLVLSATADLRETT